MTQVAVITGAARGLGQACADRFAADGAQLALVDINGDELTSTVTTLKDAGARVIGIEADIRTRQACSNVMAKVIAEFGDVDVLVNAAGVYPRRPVLDITEEDWRFVFDVNVLGTYFMAVETIARMRAGGGSIVNISSVDGFKAHPDNAHYAATKAAVISLTRSLALEAAPLGIRINSVAPGPMATEEAKRSDWYQPMVDALPTGKPIEAAEVAELVAFLSRRENVSIAGENIVVSGAGVIV